MTNELHYQRMQTAIILARRAGDRGAYQIAADVQSLAKIAVRLRRRAERECNYGFASDAAAARAAALDDRDYKAAGKIAVEYGATVERMGDVRGYALKLIWNEGNGPSNSFGARNTWGIV
jgi:hypothetical protein